MPTEILLAMDISICICMPWSAVRLGDTSVEAYDRLISLFKNCMVEMQAFVEIRNGLGLEDSILKTVML